MHLTYMYHGTSCVPKVPRRYLPEGTKVQPSYVLPKVYCILEAILLYVMYLVEGTFYLLHVQPITDNLVKHISLYKHVKLF